MLHNAWLLSTEVSQYLARRMISRVFLSLEKLQILLKETDEHRLKMFICLGTTNPVPLIWIDLLR